MNTPAYDTDHSIDSLPAEADSTPRRYDLVVEGMTCASCVARVERSIRRVEGVRDVAVNLATGRARVLAVGEVQPEAIIDRVERAGYAAHAPVANAPNERAREAAALRRRVAVALPAAALVLVLAMGPMLVSALHEVAMRFATPIAALQLAATLVVIVAGWRFFTAAWRNARHITADMNTLVAVGTGAAFLYSVVMMVRDPAALHTLYFDTVAVVIALVLLGRWLEARALDSTGAALGELHALSLPVAHRLGDDGAISEVPADFLRAGDRILVRPGERVAADGVVEEGWSAVDESTMTGEPMPVEKTVGAAVLAGTLNGTGALVVLVERAGDDTTLAAVTQAVEDAQAGKPPIQRLADRVASIFVPVVISIAVVAAVGWLLVGAEVGTALLRAVAVLVIACPCALGLAVPTAVIAATGNAAQRGITFRTAEAIERAARVTAVALDKTGTVTVGRPRMTALHAINGDERGLLRVAASLEARSEHPIARAVLDAARERGGEPDGEVSDFRAEPGVGIEGRVDGHPVRVRRATRDEARLTGDDGGGTVIAVERDGVPLGVIVVRDTVRPEAERAVRALHTLGLRTAMLTGDTKAAASPIAEMLGLELHAELLPTDKGEMVKRMQSEGAVVAMVGDGVNDTVALAGADLGVAMGAGSDLAIGAADITLLGGRIERLPEALRLARRTMSVIRWNFVWAFGYNIVGIPLAAFGLLDPMIAGAAMALSSVSVVTNSLRLKRRSER